MAGFNDVNLPLSSILMLLVVRDTTTTATPNSSTEVSLCYIRWNGRVFTFMPTSSSYGSYD